MIPKGVKSEGGTPGSVPFGGVSRPAPWKTETWGPGSEHIHGSQVLALWTPPAAADSQASLSPFAMGNFRKTSEHKTRDLFQMQRHISFCHYPHVQPGLHSVALPVLPLPTAALYPQQENPTTKPESFPVTILPKKFP